MVSISCTADCHHIAAEPTDTILLLNWHYLAAYPTDTTKDTAVSPKCLSTVKWFYLKTTPIWAQEPYSHPTPPQRNKKVVCYFNTRLQPWLEIVTVNTTPSYNINLSLPNHSNYGKAKRTKGRRNAIRDSLRSLWLGSTLPSELLDDLFVTQRVGIELVWKECLPIAAAARSLALVYGQLPQQRGVLCRIIGYCAGGKTGLWGTVRGVAYITIDDTNLALWTNW